MFKYKIYINIHLTNEYTNVHLISELYSSAIPHRFQIKFQISNFCFENPFAKLRFHLK